MQRLLFWLLKFCAVLLVAVGLLAAVGGGCGTAVFTALWISGDHQSAGDRRAWLVCAVVGIAGGLLLWTGARLLRAAGSGPKGDGSLRLRETGPQRRRTANAGLRDTLIWLFVAAEFCFIFIPGNTAARFLHALQGGLAAYLGLHAVILLHELGHLLLAALFGFDLQKLQVGTGPVLLAGRLGGLQLEWRALLGGGFVLTADERERGWRWRHWFYVAGGPAATAGGVLALAWWIEQRHRGGSWFVPSNGVADVVAIYLCAHSALLLLLTLLPTKARVGKVRTHTDGYKLLHTPGQSLEDVRNLIIVTCLRRVETLWEDGRRELVWTRLRAMLARHPARTALAAAEGHFLTEAGDHAGAAASYERWLGTDGLPDDAHRQLVARRFAALARAGQPDAARHCCANALRELASADRPALLDALTTEVLTHELRAFLPDADSWSQEALALKPETITLKGTRGSVLVELGCLDEGEAMLREVWAASGSEVDAAFSAFYLGVAAKRHGHGDQVVRWFRRSRSFAPYVGKWLTERLARETVAAPLARAVSV